MKDKILIAVYDHDTGFVYYYDVCIDDILLIERYDDFGWKMEIEGIKPLYVYQDYFEDIINEINELGCSVTVVDPNNPTKNYFPNNKLN